MSRWPSLKPHQKVLFKFALGRVFAGFFDICHTLVVLTITLFSQSGDILLTATTIRVGILEDVIAGSSPTLGLFSALFSHFRKEDLWKKNGQNGVNEWANNQ